jgi:hypothetical protein
MAGRPVIGGFRIRGGSYPDYDHIMPVYGVCYSSGNSLATSDVFTLTGAAGARVHGPHRAGSCSHASRCTRR